MTNEREFDDVDMFADEPRKRASHRSELVPIGGPGGFDKAVESWHRMGRLALDRMTRIRREDCPGCKPNSSTHRHCTSRNDPSIDHGLDDQPLCRHAEAAAVDAAVKAQLRERHDRLMRAQVLDPEVRRLATFARLPQPPLDYFDDLLGGADRYAQAGAQLQRFMRRGTNARIIVVAGPIGGGKSVLAAHALAGVESGGFYLQATHVDSPMWREARHRAQHADVLVLDDLGREDTGKDGWIQVAIAGLLADRLDTSHLTIATTNFDGDSFIARYCYGTGDVGARLGSRLNAYLEWASVGTQDLRAAAARARSTTR